VDKRILKKRKMVVDCFCLEEFEEKKKEQILLLSK